MKLNFFTLALITGVLALSSCKKDTPDTKNPQAVDPLKSLNLSDADGILVGIKSITTQSTPAVPGFPSQEIEVEVGTAVAAFGNLQSGSFDDVGDVQFYLGSNPTKYELAKQENNSYVYTPGTSNPNGVDFGNNTPFWEVPGKSISTSGPLQKFPNAPTITSNTDEVVRANGYDFTVSFNSGADSVLYIIAAEGKFVSKTATYSSNNSVTFTAAELNTLAKSDYGLLQVTPYFMKKHTTGGKNYYMINETVVTKTVKIK